jgi:hypothetical protein
MIGARVRGGLGPIGRTSIVPAVVAAVVATLVGACTGLASPTRPVLPSLTPTYGLTWAMAPDVELPSDAFEVSSHPPTGPAGPDTAGHPGHFPGQGIIEDVAVSPSADRLVAVGYVGIAGDWRARAWTSTDGATWRLAAIDDHTLSFAVSVAAGPDGGFVAVGHIGPVAAAWRSSDGLTWTAASVDSLVMSDAGGAPTSRTPDQAERMTAVVATPGGLLAGGSVGPELGGRRARFWSSTDGAAWAAVADQPAVFDGAEVEAITVSGHGIVAVGDAGPARSLAWTSSDGEHWDRVDDQALARGHVVSAVVAPPVGYVAVGSVNDEREAAAWTSPDGQAWTLAPTEPSRLHSGEKIRMTDVVATDQGLVGVGNYVGLQYGTGTSWLSSDGSHWTMAPDQPTFGQGEPEAVITWRDRLVIVGSRGAPDNYIPTVWLSPGLP